MRANRFILGALFAFAFALTPAQAIPLDYELGTGSFVTANSGSGLQIQTSLFSGLADQAFTLNDGASYTFNFFKIWTDESTVDSDDTVMKPITATLDFDVPDLDAKVQGITIGGKY